MSIFSKQIREIGIISIILIILFSFGLLVYIQNITEHEIKDNLFLQQKQRQISATQGISMHIGSDMNLVVSMLDGLANSLYLQQGIHSDNAKKIVGDKYSQFKGIIDGLFVLDKDNILTISYSKSGSQSNLGADYSFRGWVENTRLTLRPVFSDGFDRQDTYTIFISYPIVSKETGQYIGLIATSIPSVPFFSQYENFEDTHSQFMVAYNIYGTMLAHGLNRTFVGENFFGDYTQQFIHHNAILNNLTRNLLAGNPGFGVYDYGIGERLNTQYPIFVNGEPIYFIQVVTPTTEITSQVKALLSVENSKMFMLLGCTIAAISVLIIILIKWTSSLDMEVKRRTRELDESNKQLALANQQLTMHDKMQNEFINVAAHELKTPIQPIISLAEHLKSTRKLGSRGADMHSMPGEAQLQKKQQQQQDELIDVIIRNAKRLRRLAENILDVTKIEAHSLFIKKERFNLNNLVFSIVTDFRNQIAKENKDVKLEFVSNGTSIEDGSIDEIFVDADKDRISQVISNLLNNAIKSTKAGTITVIVNSMKERVHGNDTSAEEVIVTVKDTGSGVDPEILPRLFTKFATKSQSGTGLGLFISKNIIESHGGKIWLEDANGKNNNNVSRNNGATFSFSLPISNPEQLSSKLMSETYRTRTSQ
jgi:signal transduction histidine kinase